MAADIFILEGRRPTPPASPKSITEERFEEARQEIHGAEVKGAIAYIQACGAILHCSREEILHGGLGNAYSLAAPKFDRTVDVNGALFRDKEDLRVSLGEENSELVRKTLEHRHNEQMQAMPALQDWASKAIDSINTIAHARLNGVDAGQILRPEDIRGALATEEVSNQMRRILDDARCQIHSISGNLSNQSGESIKVAPLSRSVNQLNQMCKQMLDNMSELEKLTQHIKSSEDNGSHRACSEIEILTEQAREVFKPFLTKHIITMEQFDSLQAFLSSTHRNYGIRGILLKQGISVINKADAMGNYQRARGIEFALKLDEQLADFKAVTSALRNDITAHCAIFAAAEIRSNIIRRSVAPAALEQAMNDLGLPSNNNRIIGDSENMGLVLPANCDLELSGA